MNLIGGGDMPRIPRKLADGHVYHLLNRCHEGGTAFNDALDYLSFLDLLNQSAANFSVRVFSYCLMPDHFHLIVLPERVEDLGKWMQWFMTKQVRRHHQRNGTYGQIWEARFRSFPVQTGISVENVRYFVESNPVRAGLVKSVEDWSWSSVRGTGFESSLDKNETSAQPARLRDADVDRPLTSQEIARIVQCVRRQMPYGERAWQEEVCCDLGIDFSLRLRGRPRK